MKITVNPLFFALGIACAFFGNLPSFVICVLTALLHECGHIFYAVSIGYSCKKISLMPYGASAICNVEGISYKDEIFLALAGPAVNAMLCVGCAGLWWFFPETYTYTDVVMQANVAMLVINSLPAYPLDGSRVLSCVLHTVVSQRVTNIVVRVMAAIFAVVGVALYFLWVKNVSILILSAFLIVSAFDKGQQAEICDFSVKDKLKGGLQVKYVLVDGDITFRKAIKFLDGRKYLILQLYDGDCLQEMTQDEIYQKLLTSSIYDKVF